MNEPYEPDEDKQFKLHLDHLNDHLDEPVMPSEINEMRLEKIGQRVTLISILIPVLIVIVLVIAYLDIKKRVVQTEDTGAIEFQKLSSDLESRFSSLSLRQAKLEDDLAKWIDQNNNAMAAVQVRLEKMQDAVKTVSQAAAGHKDLKDTREELVKQINSIVQAANEAGTQTAAISQKLNEQMSRLGEELSAARERMSELDQNVSAMDDKKIEKPAMDLALRLESLKIENALKVQIESLQGRIKTLEGQLAQVKSRSAVPVPQAPSPAGNAAPNITVAPRASDIPAPSVGKPDKAATDFEEQTITK